MLNLIVYGILFLLLIPYVLIATKVLIKIICLFFAGLFGYAFIKNLIDPPDTGSESNDIFSRLTNGAITFVLVFIILFLLGLVFVYINSYFVDKGRVKDLIAIYGNDIATKSYQRDNKIDDEDFAALMDKVHKTKRGN